MLFAALQIGLRNSLSGSGKATSTIHNLEPFVGLSSYTLEAGNLNEAQTTHDGDSQTLLAELYAVEILKKFANFLSNCSGGCHLHHWHYSLTTGELLHGGQDKMVDMLQMTFWIHLLAWKFDWFHRNLNSRVQLTISQHWLGLVPNSWKIIAWTNDDLVYWHIYVSFGFCELLVCLINITLYTLNVFRQWPWYWPSSLRILQPLFQ